MLIKLTDVARSSIEIHAYYAEDDGLDGPEFLERHRTLQVRASAKGIALGGLSASEMMAVANAMDEIADVEDDSPEPVNTKGLRSAASKVRRIATVAHVRSDWPAGTQVLVGGRLVPVVDYSDEEAELGKVRIRIGGGDGPGTLVSIGYLSKQ